jgi:hypothetical protein
MKSNLSSADRILRILGAAIVALLYFTNVISGTIAIVLFIVAAILIVTSLINFCPLYAILGISTNKKPKSANS